MPKKGSSEILVAEPDGEVEVAEEEEDACAVVFDGSEATSRGFDLLDFAIKAFAKGVGETADEVVEQACEMALDHGRDSLES